MIDCSLNASWVSYAFHIKYKSLSKKVDIYEFVKSSRVE